MPALKTKSHFLLGNYCFKASLKTIRAELLLAHKRHLTNVDGPTSKGLLECVCLNVVILKLPASLGF